VLDPSTLKTEEKEKVTLDESGQVDGRYFFSFVSIPSGTHPDHHCRQGKYSTMLNTWD
jgi:hypothetical protein